MAISTMVAWHPRFLLVIMLIAGGLVFFYDPVDMPRHVATPNYTGQ